MLTFWVNLPFRARCLWGKTWKNPVKMVVSSTFDLSLLCFYVLIWFWSIYKGEFFWNISIFRSLFNPIWHGGGALCARTNLTFYLWLIQSLKVWNFFRTFPNYVCTSFWSNNQNIFLGGCPHLAPSKKCRQSRTKSKKYFCNWPPIFILQS
jgi:hypothetical protein